MTFFYAINFNILQAYYYATYMFMLKFTCHF